MSNIGTFVIKQSEGYAKLEDIIKEQDPSFSFAADTEYLLQKLDSFSVLQMCADSSVPQDNEGFIINDNSKFSFIPGTDPLYVKSTISDATLYVYKNS